MEQKLKGPSCENPCHKERREARTSISIMFLIKCSVSVRSDSILTEWEALNGLCEAFFICSDCYFCEKWDILLFQFMFCIYVSESVTIQFLSGHLFQPARNLPQVCENERKTDKQRKGEGAWKESWMNGVLDGKVKEEKKGDGCQFRMDCLFNAQSI